MLDYVRRFMIAGIVALFVSLLFFGGKPQAEVLEDSAQWIWPTEGIITDTFGTRLGSHKGIDIAAPLNTPVFTVDSGIVSKSYYSDTYGHVIFVKHQNNLETVYAHLNKRMVDEGESVTKGEMIGKMGNTGKSSGVHLHFEVHENEWTYEKENALNPALLFGTIEVGTNVQASSEPAHFVVKPIDLEGAGKDTQLTKYHKVKNGETLWSIAQLYSTNVGDIQQINQLKNTTILVDQTLEVPNIKNNVYLVKIGDTLSTIAHKTNISIEKLKRYNQLQTDRIYPSQMIQIPNSNE